MTSWVEVALPLPLFRTFTYGIEGEPPLPGTRVLVPFRRGEKIGWVLGPGETEGIGRIRTVLDVLDQEPSVPADLLRLAAWISDYYVVPPGLALRSMVPAALTDSSRDFIRLTERGAEFLEMMDSALRPPGTDLPARALRVLEAVWAREGVEVRVASLSRKLGMGSIWPEIRRLRQEALLEHRTESPPPPPIRTRRVVRIISHVEDLMARDEIFGRARRQRECFELLERVGGERPLQTVVEDDGFSRSVITGLEEKGLVSLTDEEVLRDPFGGGEPTPPQDFRLTPAQAAAVRTLVGALDEDRQEPFLLHGVTGSGKTLVYIRLLQEVVEARGRTAIVLVPEISLTPQAVSRFRSWFGDRVAVLHSGLSDGERFDQWRQIRRGEKPIVVGARSALFAPLADLGAIVVDEEHDGSYKQSEAPRYGARDVAVVRALAAGAVCVLGSATPSLESWTNVERGKFRKLSLPERVGGRAMPKVDVIDLRRYRPPPEAQGAPGRASTQEGGGVLAPPLVEAVRTRLGRGEQSILLLNRRGYSSFVQCRECGEVQECPECSVSLTFHRSRRVMLCHHCRHEEPAPERCPRCGGTDLSFRGLGTEQVERVVGETFPQARIARMDVDTTSGKWSHAEILGRVERREVDILLGTQMIAKGLDFPWVTLVGVVNADVGLHFPDFRASERTFQLLSQVAGRAGRGELGGEVLIQTSLPGHYAVQCALTHDYEGFAKKEMAERAAPLYPPLVRLVNLVVSSPDPELAAAGAEAAARWVGERLRRAGPGGALVGPAPAPIERLHGRWRWHFFLRGGAVEAVTRLLRALLEDPPLPPGDVRLVIDRDPVALL